ncbi:extracellular solute-binding protein [Candidatus Parcubacteria bacterium]|nr:extracellular solute-binding protein [Candidatus Parcubacteria bacterium]
MKGSNFQMIVVMIFGFFAVLAVLVFSGVIPLFQGGGSAKPSGEVVVWGTIRTAAIEPLFNQITAENSGFRITYVEKNPATFDQEFVEALASMRGPDLFLLPQNFILRHQDKIYPIPYASFSERDFRNTFIEEGELYFGKDGIIGLPISVDPLVMYYNRDILSSAGIAAPPQFWDEFVSITPSIVRRDNVGNLTQSAVALGEFKNVLYAKDILSALLFQGRNPIVGLDQFGKLHSTLLDSSAGGQKPAEAVIRFFAEFSDAAKSTYSWSRSLPSSKDRFLAERLAVYFGYASEAKELRAKNPHLNFDVVPLPQPRGEAIKSTFGRMQAVSITRSARNFPGAYFLAFSMVSQGFSKALANNLYLAPPRRDLLAAKQDDPYLEIFYQSALTARGWLDPSPEGTDKIFSDAVNNVLSGRFRVSEAVAAASRDLDRLLPSSTTP